MIPEKLRRCWHPVAYGHEVIGSPHAARLLDEALVLWRSSDGRAHAMRDLCVHRGTALSLGWVADDASSVRITPGVTTRPARASHSAVDTRPRSRQGANAGLRCQERYGLIWVCLAELSRPTPCPRSPSPRARRGRWWRSGPFGWGSDASRQVENFTDFGHFPWAHPGRWATPNARGAGPPGGDPRPRIALPGRAPRGPANSDDFPVFANEQTRPVRRSRYELHLPYTIALRLGWGGEKGMVYFFASQPIAANCCRGYCIIGRNYDLDDPDESLQKFEDISSDRISAWSNRSVRSRCLSTLPRAASAVRRGGHRLSQGDADRAARVA